MSLFDFNYETVKPLSLKLRPKNLEEFVGQEKILGKNGMLRRLIENGKISNSIFFGPPGSGKSTIGEIISKTLDYNFENLNATTASLNDIRAVVESAKKNLEYYNKKTILFLDEIHRFNKLQQDSLLSHVENGIVTLIGATTEDPYYSINNALLSRVMLFKFEKLKREDISKIIDRGLSFLNISISKEIRECILDISSGDSRIALNYLELYNESCMDLTDEEVLDIFKERKASYDKTSDKYDVISAMIKSMRGSDPDAAIYWLARLLDGGEDPVYIARRIVIQASEDVGMANPEAMLIANAAMQASEKIGMPEIRIILAQAVIYLSISTKSNSAYNAINSAMEDVKNTDEKVPSNIGSNHKDYLYPHAYENNFVKQVYRLNKKKYYYPGDNKNENLIDEKLKKLWD